MSRVDKTAIRIIRKDQGEETYDDGFINADPSYLIGIVWDLTRDAWAFRGDDAERRLQRHITNLYRRKS